MHKKIIYNRLRGIIQKRGKKTLSYFLLYSCFLFIKKTFRLNPFFIFKKALENVIPPFDLIRVKKGSQMVYTIKLSSIEKRLGYAIHWIVGFSKNSNQKFFQKMAIETYVSATKRGKAYEKKIDLLKKAEFNKTFLFYANSTTTKAKTKTIYKLAYIFNRK